MLVQICVGSSCHLKGSKDIVDLMREAVEKNKLDGYVTLAGSFCTGKCNREGVSLTIDDEVYTGITRENFNEFFNSKILSCIERGK